MSDCIKNESVIAGTVFYSDAYPSQEVWYENYVNTVAYYAHGFYLKITMIFLMLVRCLNGLG